MSGDSHNELVLAALRAIKAVFNDRSVAIEETRESLTSLAKEIDILESSL